MTSRCLTLLAVGVAVFLLPLAALGERRVAEEAVIFQAVRDGVFTVYGDRGHGTGFLIDSDGLILTNSHVVMFSSHITVQIDERTRVEGVLLAEDKSKDVAVLRVAPEVVSGRPVLELAERPAIDLAFEGEKVVAIGSPLNQKRILTSGIVSKVEEGAIISDVNINPGNSGGPLINMDSEVIALITFLDSSPRGSGVSGSVPISVAAPVIAAARTRSLVAAPPSAVLLPVAPSLPYPPECLQWAGKRCRVDKNYSIRGTRGFEITVETPPRRYALQTAETERLAGERRGREEAAGLSESEMYDPLGDRVREWRQSVGDYGAVVIFRVTPKVGETGGSAFLNALGAFSAGYSGTVYYGHSNYEFKADLQDFQVRDGQRVVPEVMRGMGMMPVSYSTARASMDDIAQRGVFVYLSDVFSSPDSDSLSVALEDLKRPGRTLTYPIPRACLEQIWVDFEPYRDMLSGRTQRLVVK